MSSSRVQVPLTKCRVVDLMRVARACVVADAGSLPRRRLDLLTR